ncbi:hypothetical protein P7D50_09485 [Enterococcus dongliensis]|uniref:phage tail assembly chaperone G n=1 Tax=Enterococcus dongliensis TaxID=2559925 RepID=UPI002890B6FA|nr:hypothetical protein [Enterococcus dongliensis]MDT2648028.1 hypothetical protein [Enterococcus dongliensis]
MAKVRLELENKKGEKMVHEKTKIKGRAVRKAIQCSRKMYAKDADMGTQLDALIELAVEVFNDPKVNEDSILDGLESDQLFDALNKVYMDILGIDGEPATDEKK